LGKVNCFLIRFSQFPAPGPGQAHDFLFGLGPASREAGLFPLPPALPQQTSGQVDLLRTRFGPIFAGKIETDHLLTMTPSTTHAAELSRWLDSEDLALVESALARVRQQGELSLMPQVARLLGHPDAATRRLAQSLLNDIKDPLARGLVLEAIAAAPAPLLGPLVASCWESGLDYTVHLPVFVELLLRQDYAVGLEALTVVQQMERPDELALRQALARVEQQLPGLDAGRQGLAQELLDQLQSWA